MRHNFWRNKNKILKTIAHTLSMSMKRKALRNKFDNNSSFKVGRRTESYTIQDAVKLVSFISVSLSEIAIVM
jgi:hypothetical protein